MIGPQCGSENRQVGIGNNKPRRNFKKCSNYRRIKEKVLIEKIGKDEFSIKNVFQERFPSTVI